MTRAKDISKIITDADFSGTLDVTGTVTADGGIDLTGNIDNAGGDMAINVTQGNLTLDASVNMIYDADGGFHVFRDGGSERMRINSDGNVLIGRTSELNDFGDGRTSLVLQGTGSQDYSTIQLGNNGTASNTQILGLVAFYDGTENNARVQAIRATSTDSADLLFWTRPASGSLTERMRIDSSGNVGIGESSPVAKTHIQGSGTSGQTTASLILENSSSGTAGVDITGSAGSSRLRFLYGGGPSTGTNTLTEAMNIVLEGSNAGNVGIGTSSADTTTQISKSTTSTDGSVYPTLKIENTSAGTGNSYARFQLNGGNGTTGFTLLADGRSSNSDVSLRTTTSTPMSFYTNNLERFVIGVNGHLYSTSNDGSLANLTLRNGSSSDSVDFQQCRSSSNALKFVIENDGDVKNENNSYGAVSDQKLKENIINAPSQWDDIKAVQVRKYSLIADDVDTPNRLGVIAQELEASGMNGLVGQNADIDEDGNDTGTVTKNVKYSILYMKAVKALQEAMTRIEILETANTALEARIVALETA